ncbi:hypothetical protein A3L11_01980 [Thermococcus siculi]|uniref:Uncharacterized protein n=1 Tax=Thermococcus siculi TaxID=72803 RepID=A0A2Z2MJU9_9EURY|nr:hypothetical protein [Thermococcus siculi]ASJ08058.1 hypothetical protein A3L11_01980 [Thermococcus siculi]
MTGPVPLDVLSASLDGMLKQVILENPSLSEPQIVNEYIGRLQQHNKYLIWVRGFGYYRLQIRSKVVHQKPYALFSSNSGPCNKSRVELGDILFVIKYHNGRRMIDQMRTSFLQAKLNKSTNNWKISAHQQEFLFTPSKYPFHFGKRWGSQRKRKITSKSKWLFTYLLMSTSEDIPNLAASPEIVELWRQKPCKDYTIPMDFFVPVIYSTIPSFSGCTWYNKFVCGSYALWLYKFLRKNGIGGYVINNGMTSNSELKDLVNTIYRFTGLQPDPPSEFEEYYGEGTFGVIEFTFTPVDERELRRLE